MSPKFRRLDESSANDDLAEDRFKRDLLVCGVSTLSDVFCSSSDNEDVQFMFGF